MDRFDIYSMAFHTSCALGLDRAQRIGNQIAAAELQEAAERERAQAVPSLDEASRARLRALDDAIDALLRLGSNDPSAVGTPNECGKT